MSGRPCFGIAPIAGERIVERDPGPGNLPTSPERAMSETDPSPEKRRRVILIAVAVLIGALILLFAVERASVVEPSPPTTPAPANP